jgi:hypothetical protein
MVSVVKCIINLLNLFYMKRNFENSLINSSYILRLISLVLMLALITPVMINAQAGKANFAGTWALNAEKSTIGQGGGGGQRGGGGDFVATQQANLLTVVRTRTNQDGEAVKTTSNYTLDGKESVNTTGRGESKSTATWSTDGKTLKIVTKTSFNGNERTSTESWTLTDAKTLTVTSTRTTQNGEVTNKMVYDKK